MTNLHPPTAAPAAPLTQAELAEIDRIALAVAKEFIPSGRMLYASPAERVHYIVLRNAWPRVSATLAAQAAALALLKREQETNNLMLISAVRAARIDIEIIERLELWRARVRAWWSNYKPVAQMSREVADADHAKLDAAQQRVGELERLLGNVCIKADDLATLMNSKWGLIGQGLPNNIFTAKQELENAQAAADEFLNAAALATPDAPGHSGAGDEGETR